jgi:hypothetical protein
MYEITQYPIENVTLEMIATNPNNFPEEVIGASLDVIIEMERKLREIKSAISFNIIGRMQKDNATKMQFVSTHGESKMLTLKPATPKLNGNIKDIEEFIVKSGFAPQMLGEFKFVPHSWGKMKEIRKQGSDIQVVIDEMYVAGNPSIEIK